RRLLGNGRLSAVEFAAGDSRRGIPVKLDALFVLAGKEAAPPPVRVRGGGKKAVFIAGEARGGCKRQVVAAAADGLSRAMECERYLQETPATLTPRRQSFRRRGGFRGLRGRCLSGGR
ncbi:MAG: hypothetical protein AAB339_06300, partial [Elusimicrobiota bacterium]